MNASINALTTTPLTTSARTGWSGALKGLALALALSTTVAAPAFAILDSGDGCGCTGCPIKIGATR